MYLTIVAALLGESCLLGSYWLLGFTVLAWIVTHSFVLLYEEPHLKATFGGEYSDFLLHVPRWIPRLTPWKPTNANKEGRG